MYMRIGIFGRCADNIYIYIDVVFTYYSKEVGSADTTATPSHLRGESGNYGRRSRFQAPSLNQ